MTGAGPFCEVKASLADVVGESYLQAVCEARACLSGEDAHELLQAARRTVDWYPADWHQRLLSHLPRVGTQICTAAEGTADGATTKGYAAASHREPAPVAGYGFYRVGEDGRLYLLVKSEHYHTPLGHAFPGYQLLETARQLGIPNATHNNSRGHITRLLEEGLVRAAHGIPQHSLASGQEGGLNRVLNLETGSLAAEAGMKMMLARFYRSQTTTAEPPYHGRIPVLLVMGNDDGELSGNYHGTTTLTQMLRGMWPELAARLGEQDTLQVCAIRPNVTADLEAAFTRYERPPYKIAGFMHEIVMMNYGARLLQRDYLQHAYALCARHDVPTMVDEIQTGLWAPGLFLFQENDLQPSMVALGKGFPGGEYPASRVLFTAAVDNLPQFGALVTNGQEELASLAYLVTMRWAQANTEAIRQIGDYYEEQLRTLAAGYPQLITGVAGQRHLLGIEFHNLASACAFTGALNKVGFDISAQTYKPECPSVALTKLPLTACTTVVDFVIARMQDALESNMPAQQAGNAAERVGTK